MSTDYTLATVERAAIVRALRAAGGVKEQAYKLLRIGRSSLYRKINKHGITPDEYKTPEPKPEG